MGSNPGSDHDFPTSLDETIPDEGFPELKKSLKRVQNFQNLKVHRAFREGRISRIEPTQPHKRRGCLFESAV